MPVATAKGQSGLATYKTWFSRVNKKFGMSFWTDGSGPFAKTEHCEFGCLGCKEPELD